MTRSLLLALFAVLALCVAEAHGAADSRPPNADAPAAPPAPGSLESAAPARPAPGSLESAAPARPAPGSLESAAPARPAIAVAAAPGSSSATLTLYLVLMVALLGGGAFLVRNGFTLFQPKVKGARKLHISETRMLGNRQFLVVAEYEDRKMLLGVCPGRIDYLATLGAAEAEFPAIEREKHDE